jgi:hypothetical protein
MAPCAPFHFMHDRSENGADEWDVRMMIAIIGICSPSRESRMMDMREWGAGGRAFWRFGMQ